MTLPIQALKPPVTYPDSEEHRRMTAEYVRETGDRADACLPKDGAEPLTAMSADALTPAQITADQNDYDTGDYTLLRLDTDALHNITGFAALAGRWLVVLNVGANSLVIQHENSGSAAENRVITRTGSDVTLAANGYMLLWYDATTTRWRDVT